MSRSFYSRSAPDPHLYSRYPVGLYRVGTLRMPTVRIPMWQKATPDPKYHNSAEHLGVRRLDFALSRCKPACRLTRTPARKDWSVDRSHNVAVSRRRQAAALQSASGTKTPTMASTESAILRIWAFPTTGMRTFARLLAILTMAALLAPSVRWTSPKATADACGCPPGACMCEGHRHGAGRLPACCMGTGGQCGVQSPDSYISAILSTLTYVPTEHPWWDPIAAWSLCYDAPHSSLLPSHARIPDQPPRFPL